ncbi:SPOCS domain-containing protein [Clostridium taeniosporum]|uniref:DUF3794 domain-containing protein n=1 Tax=Clostridium taeniosporum TaxID=394958 RepID=A0A1D7XJT4_9CLOT|nr:SPOCS domain-containing protein [Clostridium taeniosporum]AOR23339.1 DUF3794 domain-containing protein [Clostridium taeniosporum]
MGKIQRELIEYSGINTCIIKDKQNFNQINIEETFCIPAQKPDMEQINKMRAKGCIVNYEVVKTPVGTSLEGQVITGYKLLVCGKIELKVEYVACDCTQSVHTAHACLPFCAYVVLPKDINPNARLTPNVIIEDIFSEQIDERCIYNNITMMVLVDIC